MFEEVERVTFELSNTCPYSGLHKPCPLHQAKEVHTLPSRTVLDTLDLLAYHGWHKEVAFHNYSEPTADPRLFWLMREAAHRDMSVLVWTNGWNLSQQMVDELQESGATHVRVSDYHLRPELHTLTGITLHEGLPLDGRLNLYQFAESDYHGPCHAPYREMIITCRGTLGLCCLDWAGTYDQGSLADRPLLELLEAANPLHQQLLRGERNLPICRRCRQGR